MKDFFGNELFVGDTVAYMVVGYRCLRMGKIKSIGAKKITISHPEFAALDDTYQFPSQVIKKLALEDILYKSSFSQVLLNKSK